MGTPAIIAIKDGENVTWSSVNYDGYLSHTGKMLVEHYNDAEKAKALIALGDLSVLDKSIECPEGHSFDNRVDGYSVAYGRDRGESNVDSQISDYANFLRCVKDTRCRYLFEGDTWFVIRFMRTTGQLVDRVDLVRVGEILAGTVE